MRFCCRQWNWKVAAAVASVFAPWMPPPPAPCGPFVQNIVFYIAIIEIYASVDRVVYRVRRAMV